jgi:hypothetical protein
MSPEARVAFRPVGASIPDLLAEHRETLVRWGAERERFGEPNVARRATEVSREAHAQFKVLRESDEGRAGIAALMHDPNPYVASVAAAHSLLWTPDSATAALEGMERSEDVPWQVRANAKQMLKDWRAGRLSFDW